MEQRNERPRSRLWFAIAAVALIVGSATGCQPPTASPDRLESEVTFLGDFPSWAYAVAETPDGSYLLVGAADMGNATSGAWIGGVGPDGESPWSKVIPGKGYESLDSAAVAPDGGVIVAGHSWSDYGSLGWVMEVDVQGNERWSRTLGGWEAFGGERVSTSVSVASVRPTADGGYVVAGDKSYSAYTSKQAIPFEGPAWLVTKFDAQGAEEWSRAFGGTAGDYRQVFAVQPTLDGGYAVVGDRWNPQADRAQSQVACLVKLSGTGETEWSWESGGQPGEGPCCSLRSLCLAPDGGYVAAGTMETSDLVDAWLVGLDAEGNELWRRAFGQAEDRDRATGVVPTPDGNFLVCGSTLLPEESAQGTIWLQAWLRKVDPDGNELWVKTYGENAGFYAVIVTSDGGYAAVGNTYPSDEERWPWFVRTNPEGE